jgi:uncharacterized membrane protein
LLNRAVRQCALNLYEITAVVSDWIELTAVTLEILAVGIIVVSISYTTAKYIYLRGKYSPLDVHFEAHKITIGKTLLLGLEILVAADIVATVAIEPSFESVSILDLLVLIRTFLSWSLEVEIEDTGPGKRAKGSMIATTGSLRPRRSSCHWQSLHYPPFSPSPFCAQWCL